MYAGLDVGTTAVKFSVYNREGELYGEASEGYMQSIVPNRLSADAVWEATQHVIRAVTDKLPYDIHIQGMAVSAFGETVIPVDKNGRVLCESFIGNAVEGAMELKQILKQMPENEIWEITGLVPHRKFSAVKILWYRQHSSLYNQTYKFLLMEDFILYRLTGNFVLSDSSASRSMAYDRKNGSWCSKMLEAAEVEMSKLSVIVPSGSYVGTVKPGICERLGLRGGIRVFAGGHDQMCNILGAGIADSGTILNCSGTVECVSCVVEARRAESLREGLTLQLSPYPIAEKNLVFWAPVAGCSSLDWAARFISGMAFSGKDMHKLKELHMELQRRCSKEPGKLMSTPYFTGRNYPDIAVGAQSSVTGINLYTEGWEFYQSVMEGIAFEIRVCLEKMRYIPAGFQKKMIAVGGGSQSDYWLQMKANITGNEVIRLGHMQSGTKGCMLLAAVGDGGYTDLQEAMKVCIKQKDIFYPEDYYGERYQEKYHKYLEFRDRWILE